MFLTVVLVWVVGLATLVPGCVYYLFFHAQRQQYALFITLPLFWVFGFWGVAAPLMSAIKVRQVFRALEAAQNADEAKDVLEGDDAREAMIDLIASENHLPKVAARWIYQAARKRLTTS